MAQSTLIPAMSDRISLYAYFYVGTAISSNILIIRIRPIPNKEDTRRYFYIEDIESWCNFFETLIITSAIVSLREKLTWPDELQSVP